VNPRAGGVQRDVPVEDFVTRLRDDAATSETAAPVPAAVLH
jgi:hypothetical protein